MKNKNKKSLLILILLLSILLIAYLFNSYSKYASTLTDEGTAYIAQFIANTDMNEKLSLNLGNIGPGETNTYEFTITNKEGDKISDVATNCQITLKRSNNLPVDIKIYENNNTTNLFAKDETNSTDLETIYKTDNRKLEAGIETTNTYKIEVIWDATLNEEKYTEELDYIDLYVDMEQIESTK